MSNYTKTTDFEAKDSLPTGDSGKIIRGAEFETEFDAISTAIATKADTAGPTFTGTATFATISDGIISVTAFVDEDNMSSNSATLVPTQQSVKAYVDSVTTELQAQDLDFQADSGGALNIDLDTETMTFTGGTGIDTTGSGNDVSFAIDSTVTTLTGTQTLTNKTLTSADIDTPDIDGGTIDGATIATSDITVGTGKTLDVSSGTLTLADDQISGDKVEGGTIASTTITDLASTTVDTTNLEVTNIKAKDGTSAGSIADSTGVVTLASSVLTTADINGGTIDGATIGGTTAAAGSFTTVSATGNITVGGTVDGRDVATDGTKLDGIEASADVTDATNVTAAGALMDSELTNLTAVKSLNQGVATTDSPTFAGLTTTANVSFGDNDKAIFGAGSDLQIYHDGSHSYVRDSGTGHLKLQGTDVRIQSADGAENFLVADLDGAVKLYNNDAQKLQTTSTGIDVTGTIVGDGLTVDASTSSMITLNHSTPSNLTTIGQDSSGDFRVRSDNVNKLKSYANGDFELYEDTGTTAKFSWDASAESLGIGTSSPSAKFGINASAPDFTMLQSDTVKFRSGVSGTTNGGVTGSASGDYFARTTGGKMLFSTNDGVTAHAVIDASGKVGIGTTPSHPLHVVAADGTLALFSNGVDADLNIKTASAVTLLTPSTGTLAFGTSNTERMRIDSSGRLNVGQTSAYAPAGGGVSIATFEESSNSRTNLVVSNQNSGSSAGSSVVLASHGADYFIEHQGSGKGGALTFTRGTSEAMRIDSSGHLLVGTTDSGIYDDATDEGGHNLLANGQYYNSTASEINMILNRQNSDGDIVQFRKDGTTTVGSIGVHSGSVAIGDTDTGLYFNDAYDRILPFSLNSSAGRDNAIDLGASTDRFKDLYLSGTANTGSRIVFPEKSTGVESNNSIRAHTNNYLYMFGGSTGLSLANNAGEDTRIKLNDSNTIEFITASTERMRIDSSGNLLVGTTDDSPFNNSAGSAADNGLALKENGQLQVAAYKDTANSGAVVYFNRTSTDGNIIDFRKNGTTVGSIGAVSGYLYVGGTAGNDAFLSFGADGVRPATSAGAARDAAIDLGGSTNRFKDLYLSNAIYSGSSFTINEDSGGTYLGKTNNTPLRFITNNAERMRLDGNGNLLVGLTSSNYLAADDGIQLNANGTARFGGSGTSARNLLSFVNGTDGTPAEVGFIQTNGSATSYNTSSDQRLKDNIVDAPSASDDIDAIQVRSFDWKADGSHQKYGMVAQELNTVAPEAVSAPEDPEEMMGVDYSKLVPMLVKEIQSLRARVAQLETN
jgi:hypothetical protein